MTARSSRLPERAETSEKYKKSIFVDEFLSKLSRSRGQWHARSILLESINRNDFSQATKKAMLRTNTVIMYCLERELHGTASHPGVVFGVDGMIGTLICKNVDFFW